MALNPVLAQDSSKKLFPLLAQGEAVMLSRDGMSFVAKLPDKKLAAKGVVFITNRRLVFLQAGDPRKHKLFTSFEMPFELVRDINFKQPIFGANYMEGTVQPFCDAENPISGPASWSLSFMNGGCMTFLRVFYHVKKEVAANRARPYAPDISQISTNTAFADPSDPSLFYVVQPVALAAPPAGYPGYGMPYAPPPPGGTAAPPSAGTAPAVGGPQPGAGQPPPYDMNSTTNFPAPQQQGYARPNAGQRDGY
eukprot:Selendium_serpulae@DN572_c0_g1_i1.p1